MSKDKPPHKNPHAVALGKLGGSARVPKGFSAMTPEQRREAGRKGGLARKKKRKTAPNPPEPLDIA